MQKDYNQLLYDKMQAEYDQFISDLSTKSPRKRLLTTHMKRFLRKKS